MKQLYLFLLAGGVLLGHSLASQAQEMGNARYGATNSQGTSRTALTTASSPEDHTITLKVNGLLNVAPTTFVAVFNIIQVGSTPEATASLLHERLLALATGLGRLGIDSTRIHTDIISFVPRFETQVESRVFSKRFNEVPAGFELQQTVSITYHQPSLMPAILRVAAQAEIVDLVKVDPSAADMLKPTEQLREQCLQLLKTRERAYITAGFRLDTLLRTPSETSATGYPVSHYSSYQAAARPSLEAARASRTLLGGQPKITEARQTTAYYYNPVAPDQYDIVINPVVTGPVIQLSYSISVQYSPRPPKRATKQYLLLNAAGETHPVQLEP